MLVVKGFDCAREPALADLVQGHGHRVELPDVAKVDGALDRDLVARNTLSQQAADHPLLHLAVHPSEISGLDCILPAYIGLRAVVERVNVEETHRARASRVGRHDYLRHLQLAREVDRMQGAGTAESNEAELAWIEAALDGDEPDCLDHVRVRDAEDALGCILDRESKRLGDSSPEGLARTVDVQSHSTLPEPAVPDPAQHEVGGP